MPRDREELFREIEGLLRQGLASGDLFTHEQVAAQMQVFRSRFGPEVLRGLDGAALLDTMHGRAGGEKRCLAYWLEFKDDNEFWGNHFGGIGGGSALKYRLYQRSDGVWVTGSALKPRNIPEAEAIAIAREQRDELLAGDGVLASFDKNVTSDAGYSKLQAEMEKVAPELARSAWAHKYWFLGHHEKLDDYHSPRYQRFHLFKLLQMPPDEEGILDGGLPRFLCAGRFLTTAKRFDVPVSSLNRVLNQRDGFHSYWRVGTREGDSGESHWSVMRERGFVSIGWSKIGDLSQVIGNKETSKARIRELLVEHEYETSAPAVTTRKAGEIDNFARVMLENAIVLACDGQRVMGVGRVRGGYEYDDTLKFPHKRPVQWSLLDEWTMAEPEGLRTTVWGLGKSAKNLLKLEENLFDGAASTVTKTAKVAAPVPAMGGSLPDLDPTHARAEGILRRKGQLIFYGPPGTGKTYHALGVAKELAARRAFSKSFAQLAASEKQEVLGPGGLVRTCTFHPSYGYEDFIEGLRPVTESGQMVFKPRDGIFKGICDSATNNSNRNFFLVIDEINRGDVPRIFGELLTVIEADKRGISVILPLKGASFTVPSNVFLIGTMNTADRSISLLDAALRRRFGFIELMPDSSLLKGRMAGSLPLGAWLDALNTRLRKHLKRDARNLQIGHAYLMPSQPITSIAEFGRILRDDVIPLLEEYCYDDFTALGNILGTGLVDIDAGRIREEMFEANREQDLTQAVSFEEMQPLILDQEPTDDEPEAEGPEQDSGKDGTN